MYHNFLEQNQHASDTHNMIKFPDRLHYGVSIQSGMYTNVQSGLFITINQSAYSLLAKCWTANHILTECCESLIVMKEHNNTVNMSFLSS